MPDDSHAGPRSVASPHTHRDVPRFDPGSSQPPSSPHRRPVAKTRNVNAFDQLDDESALSREWREAFKEGREPKSAGEWLRLHSQGNAPLPPFEKAIEWSENAHAQGYKMYRKVYEYFVKDRYADVLDETAQVISFEDWLAKSRARVERERGVPSGFLTEATKPKAFEIPRRMTEIEWQKHQRRERVATFWERIIIWALFPIGSLALGFTLSTIFPVPPGTDPSGFAALEASAAIAYVTAPIVIAIAKRKRSWWLVAIVEILLGWWTVIGWFVALEMALRDSD